LILGIVLSIAGVGIGAILSPLYSLILFLGIFFDFVIYTLWLKRRTCWSIIWGGISGGMPILAGRVLGMGYIDPIGILLALSILFWIPTHILTFSIHYADDYAAAGIPTFPSSYGNDVTRRIIAFSTVIAAALITSGAILIQIHQGFLHLLGILSGILVMLTILMLLRPSRKVNFGLFKYASVYMLAAMLLLAI
jgi:protoheme IX farnesyltransferase